MENQKQKNGIGIHAGGVGVHLGDQPPHRHYQGNGVHVGGVGVHLGDQPPHQPYSPRHYQHHRGGNGVNVNFKFK